MAKYCANCGTEIKDGTTKCPKCDKSFVAEKKETNAMAIAGIICSFLLPLLGLIFSIVGLKKSKELDNGKEISIIGIVVSSFLMVVRLIAIVFLLIFTVGIATNSDKIGSAIENGIRDVQDNIEYYNDYESYDFN